jgi:sortase (surface protein transpeptidase)
MTHADSTPSARHRWGRYLLPAVILVLTTVGVTAIGRGALQGPDEPARSVAAAGTPSSATASAQPGRTRSGDLTTGPLMTTSAPTQISIPALNEAAPVIGLGLQADGSMQVPDDARTVGWYTKAPTPGALGPAILAGHVDYKKRPGTFARLAELKTGDSIDVQRRDGSMAMFAVTKIERYPKDKFPSTAVYGPIDHAGLRLITCGGDFDDTTGHYEDNIVVYATLRMAHAA